MFWVCIWMFFFTPEKLTPENPAGKTMYYTKISGSGVQGENRRYDYEVIAYDEKKAERTKFFGRKEIERRSLYPAILYNASWRYILERS